MTEVKTGIVDLEDIAKMNAILDAEADANARDEPS